MEPASRREHVVGGNDALETVARRRLKVIRRLLHWAKTNYRDYPWRNPHASPYQILIAELLLKRTTSTAAARLYPKFIEKFPSFSSVAEAPAEYLAKSLQPIGLYRQRADGMKTLSRYIGETYGSELPKSVEALENIPHAGPYAARAVASFAFGKKAAIVDSNVVRILHRVFRDSLPPKPSVRLVQEIADLLVPLRSHRLFNYALLDLGAVVCRYDRPRCRSCPLCAVCDSETAGDPTVATKRRG